MMEESCANDGGELLMMEEIVLMMEESCAIDGGELC